MKRYKIVVRHELIVYADSEEEAEKAILASDFMKSRTNPHCLSVAEIPMPENEPQVPIIDERRAPGT